jgi:branched-subunit amino acid transport protein AzlD
MPVSAIRSIIIILVCAACTFAERLLPFLVFRKGSSSPIVSYLGKVLPAAIMATLVVYCLRTTTFTTPGGFLPQIIAVGVTAALHLWKRNTLISVFVGTVVYMCLVQFVFV